MQNCRHNNTMHLTLNSNIFLKLNLVTIKIIFNLKIHNNHFYNNSYKKTVLKHKQDYSYLNKKITSWQVNIYLLIFI